MLDQNCDAHCFRIVEWETLHHINYISNKYLQIMIMIRCYALHITSVNTTLLAPFTTSVGPFNLFDQNDTSPISWIIGVLLPPCGHWRGTWPNVQHGKQQYIIYTHTQSVIQVDVVTVNVSVFMFQKFPVTSDPDIKDFDTWSATITVKLICSNENLIIN